MWWPAKAAALTRNGAPVAARIEASRLTFTAVPGVSFAPGTLPAPTVSSTR